jgi:membrane protease YdiL (CAAX protease family)
MTTAQTEPRDYPFWTYEDLGLLIGAVIPALLLAWLVVHWIPLPVGAAQALVYQSLFYAFLLTVLYLLVAWRYEQPFWQSLGWTRFRLAFLFVAVGPVLAIGTSALGVWLRAPDLPSPIQGLISDRRSLFITMLFATVFGPIFEELLFRGFLFPLLARSTGPWLGIVLTAVPFALIHGDQYHWSWQWVTLVGLAGAVFGFVRYKTGSTAASTLVHAGYNATFFVGYLIQKSL